MLEVAPALLGAHLTHSGVTVRITEVEAYDGHNDPGSHTYRGRTRRNATMFGPPAHLYTYFIYGMHHSANVACGPEGFGSGCLLRAGEVVAGEELARERRTTRTGRAPRHADLASGPGRLCAAMAITLAHDGTDLMSGDIRLHLDEQPASLVRAGPRVGLRLAADRPWRFWLDGEPSVSRYRPAKPRRSGR